MIQFSHPVFIEHLTGITKKAQGQRQVNYWVYMDIFGWETWLGVATALASCAAGFVVIQHGNATSLFELVGKAMSLTVLTVCQLSLAHQVGNASKDDGAKALRINFDSSFAGFPRRYCSSQ